MHQKRGKLEDLKDSVNFYENAEPTNKNKIRYYLAQWQYYEEVYSKTPGILKPFRKLSLQRRKENAWENYTLLLSSDVRGED